MSELEIVECVAMVISFISVISFYYILKRRKNFSKYLPGIMCLILVFICTTLEDVILFEVFSFLENIFAISGAILLLFASLIEYYDTFLKRKGFNEGPWNIITIISFIIGLDIILFIYWENNILVIFERTISIVLVLIYLLGIGISILIYRKKSTISRIFLVLLMGGGFFYSLGNIFEHFYIWDKADEFSDSFVVFLAAMLSILGLVIILEEKLKESEKKLLEFNKELEKRVEQRLKELKESEEKYRNILENIKESYLEVDLKGSITFFNEAAHKLLGPIKEELLGVNYSSFIYKETQIDVFRAFNKVYKTEIGKKGFQYEAKKINGEKLFLETSIYLKYDLKGNKIGFYCLIRDITERKEVEILIKKKIEKLRELDQIKSDFITRISHELKTPLVSVCGVTELLLNRYIDHYDDDIKPLIEILSRGGIRLKSLVNDILNVSQIEAGKLKINRRKENIVEIIEQCVNELFYLTKERELIFNNDIRGDCYLEVDKFQIEDVFMNLLSNALKNTPPKGIISISLEKEKEFINIKIKDTGVGLTEDEKNKLFKKFGKIERFGKGMNVNTEGSGLGLYISKEIVELHGGKIWIESEGRNKGATFIISLPKIDIIHKLELLGY